MPRSLARMLLAGLLITASSCKKAAEVVAPGSLSVVQGNLQVAAAGTALPTPVVLRVRGTDGEPLPDTPISFQVVQGGGIVDPATARSDANGEVKVKWTLGSTATEQSLYANVRGLDPVTLIATGVLPNTMSVVQGTSQTAKAGAALGVPIIVRVTGGVNLPIPGVTVTFAVSGGIVTPATAVTNSLGEVSVRWTLGTQLGAYTATASALALPVATISANAN